VTLSPAEDAAHAWIGHVPPDRNTNAIKVLMTLGGGTPWSEVGMNNDRFTEAIGDIERGLRREDPAFVQRIRHLQRRDDLTAICVFALIAVGAVLLIAGLATLLWPAWAAGLFALASSVVADEHHKRNLRRLPRSSRGRSA
jgi:hypothetical protein